MSNANKYSMRLHELKGYRASDELINFKDTMDQAQGYERYDFFGDFSKYLQDKGFKVLGYGIFGIVFKHPHLDYCIKLFDGDPAYLKFVKFCLENQQNTHLPKFRGKFMNLGQGQYAVRTEVLSQLTPEQKQVAKLFEILSDEQSQWPSPQEIISVLENEKLTLAKQYLGKNKSLFFAIKEIWFLANHLRVGLDIHGGNFMNRDGTMVIVDPFCLHV